MYLIELISTVRSIDNFLKIPLCLSRIEKKKERKKRRNPRKTINRVVFDLG